jgi:L-cysteine desulfidase
MKLERLRGHHSLQHQQKQQKRHKQTKVQDKPCTSWKKWKKTFLKMIFQILKSIKQIIHTNKKYSGRGKSGLNQNALLANFST